MGGEGSVRAGIQHGHSVTEPDRCQVSSGPVRCSLSLPQNDVAAIVIRLRERKRERDRAGYTPWSGNPLSLMIYPFSIEEPEHG